MMTRFLLIALLVSVALGTTDGEALLEAIRKHPAEDTPRLVYADWLEEHGEPHRARFIRLQIQAFRSRHHREKARLEREAEEVLREHGSGWVKAPLLALPPDPRRGETRYQLNTWERGFVNYQMVSPELLLEPETLDALGALPLLRSLKIHADSEFVVDNTRVIRAILRLKNAAYLRALTFVLPTFRDQDAALLASPILKRLRSLEIREVRAYFLTSIGMQHLVSAPFAHRLWQLELSSDALGDDSLEVLAAAGTLPSVRRLDVRSTAIQNFAPLASDPSLPALRALYLSCAPDPLPPLEAFFHSPRFQNLRMLSVWGTSEQECAVLAALEELPHRLGRIVPTYANLSRSWKRTLWENRRDFGCKYLLPAYSLMR